MCADAYFLREYFTIDNKSIVFYEESIFPIVARVSVCSAYMLYDEVFDYDDGKVDFYLPYPIYCMKLKTPLISFEYECNTV